MRIKLVQQKRKQAWRKKTNPAFHFSAFQRNAEKQLQRERGFYLLVKLQSVTGKLQDSDILNCSTKGVISD